MKKNFGSPLTKAYLIVNNYYAITDNTSISIRLNSSKHDHAPYSDNPANNLPIILYSIYSEQLNTTHNYPNPLLKSFVDSVFPVPAGPAGAQPNFMFTAPVIVIQQRSVKGVITNLLVAPKYSKPYFILAFTYHINIYYF